MLTGRRKLIALIISITVIPLGVLLFLGWRLLEQDRIFERQQVQQSVERAADLVVAALDRAIAKSEQRLAAEDADWPEGAVAVVIRDDRIHVHPTGRIAYAPVVQPLPGASPEVFADGEGAEFAKHDTL